MVNIFVVLVLAQAVLLVGSPEVARVAASSTKSESPALAELRKKANALYAEGAFISAAGLYNEGYQRSVSSHAWNSAVTFLNNLGGTRFASYQYQGALDAFLKARKLAQEHGAVRSSGAISLNLSALYLAVGDLPSSRTAVEQALEEIGNQPGIGYRAQLLAQLGFVKAREGNAGAAAGYFSQAIEAAAQVGDTTIWSTVLQKAGEEFFGLGRYDDAERYLMEAFRLRKLFRDRQLRGSYLFLSRLRMAQGDIRSAAALIQQADLLPARDAGPPAWNVSFQRGQVQRADGRIREAAESFQQAVIFARDWRQEAAPSDLSGTGTDIGLHRLYQALIDTTLELPHPPLERMFVAAEEDKAASLRQALLVTRNHDKNGSLEYWEKLAQLRQAKTKAIAEDNAGTRARVERLRYELNEMEARDRLYASGSEGDLSIEQSPNSLKRIQRGMQPEEALLSLYRGANQCYLWAITQNHFEYHRLPESAALAPLAARFRRSVETNSSHSNHIGEELYRALFGGLSSAIQSKRRWLLTTDDDVFELPFAALVMRTETHGPRYLVEEHSTERTPSAFMLSRSPDMLARGKFLGIGDGIYNTADPRWAQSPGIQSALQLPRLVASEQELRSCAAQWPDESRLLMGANASRSELEAAMRRRPAVIHIAAHFLYPPDKPDEALINLGLGRSGESEVLTREDIGNFRVPGTMVILSGCSSAATGAVPGAGIMGLSRAWLIAGAAVVIGSRWPTPDDTGELFKDLYQRLRTTGRNSRFVREVADSLRLAQMDLLRSNTWRSNPSYWAAFYVLGKD